MHGDSAASGKEQHKGVAAPVRQEKPTSSAESREDKALREELLHQPAAASADREANVSSWRRVKDLTSSRLPTFAEAMSRTKTTTMSMISSVGSIVLALLKGVCQSGQSLMPRPRLVAG